MNAIDQLIKEHLNAEDDLRLGQRFVIFYHGGQWSDLFNQRQDLKSLMMIYKWLKDNQYEDSLPERKDV